MKRMMKIRPNERNGLLEHEQFEPRQCQHARQAKRRTATTHLKVAHGKARNLDLGRMEKASGNFEVECNHRIDGLERGRDVVISRRVQCDGQTTWGYGVKQ